MIQKLTEHIWLVFGRKQGRYPFSHSLYIQKDGGVLIEEGCSTERRIPAVCAQVSESIRRVPV